MIHDAIWEERDRQDDIYGDQTGLPDVPHAYDDITSKLEQRMGLWEGELCKSYTESIFDRGHGAWSPILLEEVAEALDEAMKGDLEALRKELVQVAAVTVAWLEALRSRTLGSEDRPGV